MVHHYGKHTKIASCGVGHISAFLLHTFNLACLSLRRFVPKHITDLDESLTINHLLSGIREMMRADDDQRTLMLRYQKRLSQLKKSAQQIIHKKKLMISSALNDSAHNSSGFEDDSNDEDDKLLEGV